MVFWITCTDGNSKIPQDPKGRKGDFMQSLCSQLDYSLWGLLLTIILFSCSVLSNSLWCHRPQHTRLPCPSLSPRVCSNSCPSSQWCHPTICHPLLLHLIFPSIRAFSKESVLHIRRPKYWSLSFSISPTNEYPGLISFRIGWFDLLAVQGTLKSLLQNHSSKASVIWFSVFFMVQLSYPSLSTWLLEKLAIITLHLMVLMDNWAVVFL